MDLDFSLVCSKDLSKILPSFVWAQGPMTSTNKAQTYPTYDVTNKKKTKSVFIANWNTCWLHLFEGLNSSLAQLTGKLWGCKYLANIGKFYLLKLSLTGSKGFNTFTSGLFQAFRAKTARLHIACGFARA